MMKRILYVEDDAVNALVMQKLLHTAYSVMHVEDGETCIKIMESESFDLILMDINLGRGRMDGVEAMKKLKEKFAQLPVLAVTSYAMPEDEDRFISAGFDGYIAKPIERKELLDYIHRFLH